MTTTSSLRSTGRAVAVATASPRRAEAVAEDMVVSFQVGVSETCGAPVSHVLSHGLEGGSQLGGHGRGLLPGGEVSTLRKAVVVDELRIGLLRPALRRLVDLIREGTHRNRDLDAARIEEPSGREVGIVPIETRGGD